MIFGQDFDIVSLGRHCCNGNRGGISYTKSHCLTLAVMPGLEPGIQQRKADVWMAGSSPAMTPTRPTGHWPCDLVLFIRKLIEESQMRYSPIALSDPFLCVN
jgi:hypothetical protein